MKINFSKYNGAGNDFIVIDDRKNNIENSPSLIEKLCNRNFGIGGDGLILIKESKSVDFEIFHYTSDGNLGSLCGNGSRCAISFAYNNKIISKKTKFDAFDGILPLYNTFVGHFDAGRLKVNNSDSVSIKGTLRLILFPAF